MCEFLIFPHFVFRGSQKINDDLKIISTRVCKMIFFIKAIQIQYFCTRGAKSAMRGGKTNFFKKVKVFKVKNFQALFA